MGGGGDDSGTFVAFTIFFLVFLALLCFGFIFWHLVSPTTSRAFFAQLRGAVANQYASEDEIENAILFSDPPQDAADNTVKTDSGK